MLLLVFHNMPHNGWPLNTAKVERSMRTVTACFVVF